MTNSNIQRLIDEHEFAGIFARPQRVAAADLRKSSNSVTPAANVFLAGETLVATLANSHVNPVMEPFHAGFDDDRRA